MHELTIAEAAYLAALPKAPNNYHPFRQRRPRIERRNWVIDRMVENGYITREDGEAAKKEPLDVNPRVVSPNSIASGYFAEEVRREIAERYGEEKLYEGGLRSAPRSIRRCRPWPARRWSTASCASTRRAAGAARQQKLD